MEIGKPFKNLLAYNDSMHKSLEDKLFFTKKLPLGDYCFVDFGCADGALLRELSKRYKKSKFIGYDISEEMLVLARKRTKKLNILFTNSWDTVEEYLRHYRKNSVLILSSVIHEVYSYATSPEDIDAFWEKVLHSGFTYICIRDMMLTDDLNRVYREDSKDRWWACKMYGYDSKFEPYLNQFESKYGSIYIVKNLVHFLLKYRWTINWERELNENYFPISQEELLEKFKDKNIIYLERFNIPYLRKCIERDWGFDMDRDTHIKLIVQPKDI